MLAAPTVADLAAFTGRDEASFGPYAGTALAQSALLFSLVTRLSEYPTDPDRALLARYAIMQMADRLVLEQPHQVTMASPFASETIGSYSYSKSSSYIKASSGGETGLSWWDLALDMLTAAGAGLVGSGSLSCFDRDELIQDGVIYGPGELTPAPPVWVNANTWSG